MPAAAAAAAAAVKNAQAATMGEAGRVPPKKQTKIAAVFKSEKVRRCLHAHSATVA
jgi:hypothetical protein